MAKEQRQIATIKSMPGQIWQETDEQGLTDNDFDIIKGGSGKFYRDISGRTIHTSIDDIRAMGANGVPPANKNVIYKTMDFGIPGEWVLDSNDTTTDDDKANCIVTADGKRLKKFRPLWVNVRDFGCIPDGKVIYENVSKPPSKGDGPDRSGNLSDAISYINEYIQINSSVNILHYHLTPILIIPPGMYNIKTPIQNIGKNLWIIGYNSVLKADQNWDQENPLFSWDGKNPGMEEFYVNGVRFDGFNKCIDIYNKNAGGEIRIEDSWFINATDYAVRLSCRSSTASINNCRFESSNIDIITCNKVNINQCRFHPSMDKSTGNYVITIENDDPQYGETANQLHLTNCFLVPRPNPDFANSAWIYNKKGQGGGNSIIIDQCRVGGEGTGGLPLILNEGDNNTHYGHHTSLRIINTEVSAGVNGTTDYEGAIILKDIPNLIDISSCTGFSGSKAIAWHPNVDVNTIISNVGVRMINISVDKYTIIGNNYGGSNFSEYIRTFIPNELRPYMNRNLDFLSQELPSTEIDFRFSERTIYQNISADTTYTVSNEIDGKELNILFTNTDTSDHVITLTGVTLGDSTDSFSIPSNASVMMKLVSINSVLVGWVNTTPKEQDLTAIKSIADDYQMINDDYTILVDTVTKGADINITLPDTPADKQKVKIVNFLSDGSGSSAVVGDGQSTVVTISFKDIIELQYFNNSWAIVGQGTIPS